jgi:two-component system, NtrC family, sensor histidine kinase HydH
MEGPPDRKFALLARVIEISNSNIEIENRLKYISDFLCREMEAECVCIYEYSRRDEELAPWVSSCVRIDSPAGYGSRIRPGEGVAGKAAQKRVPVYFPDVRKAPPSLAVPGEIQRFASILSVPITDDVYLYGVMNVATLEPVAFPPETVDLLRVVATEVAGAIRNSRLYRDARKRVSELITLNEISRTITSTFQLRDILDYVAKTTLRLLSADGCTVRLAGKVRGGMKVAIDEGYERPGLRREVRALGSFLARRIVQEKRPLLINGPEDAPLFFALSQRGITSFLGLPILSKGNVLGVISYYSCSPRISFDMEVVHLMQTVCSQLANMVENVTMFQEARQLAQENQAKVQRLSTLYGMSRALMSTVKTERLLQIMLGALTSPTGLNFSRAILFLLSSDRRTLVARMGAGPFLGGPGTAGAEGRAEGVFAAGAEEPRNLLRLDVERLSIPAHESECLVAQAVQGKRAVRTTTGCGRTPPLEHSGEFCGSHPSSFAVVPLVSKDEARGAIYVDNMFREREITDEDIQALTMFASEACLALENAGLVESLEGALGTIRSTQDRLVQSEKLAALGEMAARIAHEIKNPLTVIGGFASRMARRDEGDEDSPTARYAGIILREVQRLERIIHQTLYFSRDVVPEFRDVFIVNEIREVLAMFREDFEKAGIVTVTDLAPDVPKVSGDPDQLRQVLWNLISNAVQAMEHGGTLTVSARPAVPEEGDGVVFQVGDTGGGISHDVVHNIFNPFFTTKAKGTGLGLPIVHTIVENHGGTIHLDNREGKGINISVFLPRVPKEEKPADRILSQLRKGGADGIAFKNHTK